MKKPFFAFLITLIAPLFLWAQIPDKPTSADIHGAIKKLNFLGTALYIAAHPDDENTRLISYLSNEIHANTAYLAITRGDGGQNLIGTEIREGLGIIRTQELLAARRIDGAQQFFTRANDFGYSKNPEETFKIWNKQEVLSDVVQIIRKFRPDVIINRFNVVRSGRTHGLHTASAILSIEAFKLAADKNAFTSQLDYVRIWQPQRLFFNTSWFFYGSREKFAEADKTNLYNVDAGVFYPLKGRSNNELASEARTMHKSQGFGSRGVRGTSIEYLEWLKGSRPKSKNKIFEGINTTWSRVKGGKTIGDLISKIETEFSHENPDKSIQKLIEVYKLIDALPDGHWKKIKLKEVKSIIQFCAGLYFEVVASDYYASPNTKINLQVEVINRSKTAIKLHSFGIKGEKVLEKMNKTLDFNKDYTFKVDYTISKQLNYTNAYWLNNEGSIGLYSVKNKQLIGLAETPPALVMQFNMNIEGLDMQMTTDIIHKKTDPVRGEVYRRFEIVPPVFANIKEAVYIFSDTKSKTVNVTVKSGRSNIKGILSLDIDKTWQVSTLSISFEIKGKGEEKHFTFKVTAPKGETVSKVKASVLLEEGKVYSYTYQNISYTHIPAQLITRTFYSKFVRLPIKRKGQNIGYIMGAGDVIPTSLQQIGYSVMLLKDEDITTENLKNFDAVIIGIRAYNINERLKFQQDILHNYVANGGTIIAQYNTSRRIKVDNISPYLLKLSRDRVTVETAKVTILNKNHEVLNFPNKITAKDFDGWVQERGLYFPDEWDENFEPILSMQDPGETPKKGSLLVAKYKKGYFIYTGLSFFRELPAGVPGAYKLFANLISIGKNDDKQSIKQ